MEYRNYRVIYRRYASLFFIVGVDQEEENELGILEFIHALVETLDKCAHLLSERAVQIAQPLIPLLPFSLAVCLAAGTHAGASSFSRDSTTLSHLLQIL